MSNNSDKKSQIVYFSHGGGPLPLLNDPGHQAMIRFMSGLPQQLRRPDAILVISAHWEEKDATLLGAENPGMLYDYYGFPEETYQVSYPAPGNPTLVREIQELLAASNISTEIDPQRGYDHGLFIPMMMMYPHADIPCIQLSLLRGLDAAAHIELGKALRPLNSRNLLVVGSGFSFHNMNAFSWGGNPREDKANDAFQDWLIEVCSGSLTQSEREQALVEWQKAPNARYCHPREEHLLPLHVCQGMADKEGKIVFNDYILGKRAIAVLW